MIQNSGEVTVVSCNSVSVSVDLVKTSPCTKDIQSENKVSWQRFHLMNYSNKRQESTHGRTNNDDNLAMQNIIISSSIPH